MTKGATFVPNKLGFWVMVVVSVKVRVSCCSGVYTSCKYVTHFLCFERR